MSLLVIFVVIGLFLILGLTLLFFPRTAQKCLIAMFDNDDEDIIARHLHRRVRNPNYPFELRATGGICLIGTLVLLAPILHIL